MKAITRERFGSPDVLRFQDIERPAIPTGHVLVDIDAAGVNRGDALELRGWPHLARLMGFGIHRPAHRVLGTDIAGRAVARSADVHEFDIDDEVVGIGRGAFAQLATVPASMLIPRPGRIHRLRQALRDRVAAHTSPPDLPRCARTGTSRSVG